MEEFKEMDYKPVKPYINKINNRVLQFIAEKEADLKRLEVDLYFILDEAYKYGEIPYRKVAFPKIVGDELIVEVREASYITFRFDLSQLPSPKRA